MSGVLKDAIDWASRPPDQPFNGKPTAIFGASPGAIGTAVAQYELRRYLGSAQRPRAEHAERDDRSGRGKFDEQGRLTDQPTRELIGQLLVALAEWTCRHGR